MSDTAVRYESDRVFVEVFHDHRTYEVGVEIGLLADESVLDSTIAAAESHTTIGRPTGEYQFSLDEVVSLTGDKQEGCEAFAAFAYSAEQVVFQLSRFAAGMKKHAAYLLQGKRGDFESLAMRRTTAAQAFTHDMLVAQLRRQADAAWRERRFASVVTLLAELGDGLTPAERKKLEYARAHVSQD